MPSGWPPSAPCQSHQGAPAQAGRAWLDGRDRRDRRLDVRSHRSVLRGSVGLDKVYRAIFGIAPLDNRWADAVARAVGHSGASPSRGSGSMPNEVIEPPSD